MTNIVIAGMGEVGYNLARALAKEGHNITAVEMDEEVIARVCCKTTGTGLSLSCS